MGSARGQLVRGRLAGGFDLGFERAGLQCKWQVEIDPFCWQVLFKHWPDIPKWDDVRTFPPDFSNEWNVDVICGGFPCQDISDAGPKKGINGERSGLWREFARIIRVLRPRYVVVENVAALFDRGIDRVLGDLAACGLNAEWSMLPACALGFPHARERVFIVAYANGRKLGFGGKSEDSAKAGQAWCSIRGGHSPFDSWTPKDRPPFVRAADGIPNRLDRLRALGNAVVPQVAQWIGERIIAAHQGQGE